VNDSFRHRLGALRARIVIIMINASTRGFGKSHEL
jgi:hypothetical protein